MSPRLRHYTSAHANKLATSLMADTIVVLVTALASCIKCEASKGQGNCLSLINKFVRAVSNPTVDFDAGRS